MDTIPSPTPQATTFSSDLKQYSDTVLSVDQSTRDFLWHRHLLFSFFLFFLPICASIGIAYLELSFATPSLFSTTSTFLSAVLLTILPLLIPSIAYAYVRETMQKLFYSELATALACTYSPEAPQPTSGQLFSFGTSLPLFNVFSGTYKTIPFRLADYKYYIRSGKNAEYFYYILGEITTSSVLPRLMVIPSSWTGALRGNPWEPSGTETLSVEGDFNTKFKVYVEKGKEIEGLQILEPDVMLKLMDGFEEYGFECVGSTIFLFTQGTMSENRNSVIKQHALLQQLVDILLPELAHFTL
jgi:hypothetical protein